MAFMKRLNYDMLLCGPGMLRATRRVLHGTAIGIGTILVTKTLQMCKHIVWLILMLVGATLINSFVAQVYYIPSNSMARTINNGEYILVSKWDYLCRTNCSIFGLLECGGLHQVRESEVQRGDVIVFSFPRKTTPPDSKHTQVFVKRCVGLPGDTIEMRRGNVYVNGNMCESPGDAGPLVNGVVTFGAIKIPRSGDTIVVTTVEGSYFLRVSSNGMFEVPGEPGNSAGDKNIPSRIVAGANYFFVMGDNRLESNDSRVWGLVPEHALLGRARLVLWSRSVGASDAGRVRWDRLGTMIR
jgi:signal peptidase I